MLNFATRMKQTLILVDEGDMQTGYAPKEACHTGNGMRHRAFVTIVFDRRGRVILQKRKHKLFDGFWDLTAISHNLHISNRNESYQEASDRALKKEMGISHIAVKKAGGFSYFARDGKNCENEYCAILIGSYNGKIIPNKEEVYEFKKVDFNRLVLDVFNNPKKYTPWAVLAVKELNKMKFSSLSKEIEAFLSKFTIYQEKFFGKKIREGKKYSPLIEGFYKELSTFSKGGKKLRPFLVYLGYTTYGKGEIDKILPVALAFELVHSFLLIHDDIIDKSEVRRGKATMHKVYEKKLNYHYGISQAIIIGDIACFEAFRLISESNFSPDIKNSLVRKFSEVLVETGYGEALDVYNSNKKAGFGEIEKVTNLKTARYSFVGPLLLGAIAGRMRENSLKRFIDFGLLIGSAFQLTDDILGIFGDEEVTGKSSLSDIREGKNTLLIHKAKQLAKGKELKFLSQTWGNERANMDELKKVRKIVEVCGALTWARAKNRQMIEKAKKKAVYLTKNSEHLAIFNDLCEFVGERES